MRKKGTTRTSRCFQTATALRVAMLAAPKPASAELKSAVLIPMLAHIETLRDGEWRAASQDNELVALANLVQIMGWNIPSASMLTDGIAMGAILQNIRSRWLDTKRWAATGDELSGLDILAGNIREYLSVVPDAAVASALDIHEKWLFAAYAAGQAAKGIVPIINIQPKNWNKALKKQMEMLDATT